MTRMHILLIRPENNYSNNKPNGMFPMGLLYISGYLKSKLDCDTTVLDFNNQQYDLKQVLEKTRYDYIGISATSLEYEHAVVNAKKIKSLSPETSIILGGPHITAAKEIAFENSPFDYGIVGEGEIAFFELINALEKNVPIDNIDGLVYKNNNQGIIVNSKYGFVEDLDSLPFPDWDVIDIKKYGGTMQYASTAKIAATIVTSRGCPYSCAFCHSIQGKKARLRSAKNVFQEILTLYNKYDVRTFEVIDDIFNIDPKRLAEICNLIIQSNIKISIYFGNGLRGDLLDEEQIMLLKKAGTKIITFAVEFGSKRMQSLLRKNIDLVKIEENIRIANMLGICTVGYFMLNGPGETIEEMQETSRFVLRSKLDIFYMFFLCPFPSTDVYKMLTSEQQKEFAGLSLSKDYLTPDFYNISKATKMEMLKLYRETLLKFMFNPQRIIHFLLTHPYPFKLIRLAFLTGSSTQLKQMRSLLLKGV